MNYAITNFWSLQETNEEAYDAIYRAMIGDAYSRSNIEEALSLDEDSPDMSDYTYYPVISEQQAKHIGDLFGVKLSRAMVRKRSEAPSLYELTYELTHISPHQEL